MINIAVYGTLREPNWSWQMFIGKKPDSRVVLNGYKMGVNFLPFCILTGNANDRTVFDLYEVSDDTFEIIDRMETFSGYKREIMTIKNKEYIWWSHAIPHGSKIIEDYNEVD